jgi:hypothetical protein
MMQETAGTRVMRPVSTFGQPAYHRGPRWARVAMPSTYTIVNPIPDHGGTVLSE